MCRNQFTLAHFTENYIVGRHFCSTNFEGAYDSFWSVERFFFYSTIFIIIEISYGKIFVTIKKNFSVKYRSCVLDLRVLNTKVILKGHCYSYLACHSNWTKWPRVEKKRQLREEYRILYTQKIIVCRYGAIYGETTFVLTFKIFLRNKITFSPYCVVLAVLLIIIKRLSYFEKYRLTFELNNIRKPSRKVGNSIIFTF